MESSLSLGTTQSKGRTEILSESVAERVDLIVGHLDNNVEPLIYGHFEASI